MRNALSRINRAVVEDFASSNVLLAFDYDGTLAPIVEDPARATLRPRTRALLEGIVALYPVIVLSGRAQPDIARRLDGLNVARIVGNHGIESWRVAEGSVAEVRRWLPAMEKTVASLKGCAIEDKSYSIAVHYRSSREKKKARASILRAAAVLGDVRIIAGKQVVNILPRQAPHKGVALERERERLGCDTAIYVGDDKADEDVFTLDQPGRLLTIRVGVSRTSAAMYAVASQTAVDALLHVLLSARRRTPTLMAAIS